MPALDKLLNSSAFSSAASCPEVKSNTGQVQVEVNPNRDMEPAAEQDAGTGLGELEGVDKEGVGIDMNLKPCEQGKDAIDLPSRRIEHEDSEFRSSLSLFSEDTKMVMCLVCQNVIYDEEILCSVRGCRTFHPNCAKKLGFSSSKQFKCPLHACFVCKQKNHLWRCIRCPKAFHKKCAPFPEDVIYFPDRPQEVICWRHPSELHLEEQHEDLATSIKVSSIKEIFSGLPLPSSEEEFTIDPNWKYLTENNLEPPPYAHIKRNFYLVKKKRSKVDADIGCESCSSSECSEACVCRDQFIVKIKEAMLTNDTILWQYRSVPSFKIAARLLYLLKGSVPCPLNVFKVLLVQCISCSTACHCKGKCKNRPFQKEKKIKIVKTEQCGWGVVAADSIKKGDFVIEYVGEVIDDALCEQRLWEMKDQGAKNFYMCEIRKDFVIDATFKGNYSRFLNHSCAPNCKLEKWQVDGDSRVGVFAARSIKEGEPLTYDYKFEQFGPEVECRCGAENCQGYLGNKKNVIGQRNTKRNIVLNFSWGLKRRRSFVMQMNN